MILFLKKTLNWDAKLKRFKLNRLRRRFTFENGATQWEHNLTRLSAHSLNLPPFDIVNSLLLLNDKLSSKLEYYPYFTSINIIIITTIIFN